MSVLVTATLALGLALQSGAMATRRLQEDQILLAQSQTFADRLSALECGHDYDPDPTGSQVEEVFDADGDPGTATLSQLTRFPSADGGWRFRRSDFTVPGEWTVAVDNDLDGNGWLSGALETDKRVFRIRILFDGRLILETGRAMEVTL